jgi:hypothetical protein
MEDTDFNRLQRVQRVSKKKLDHLKKARGKHIENAPKKRAEKLYNDKQMMALLKKKLQDEQEQLFEEQPETEDADISESQDVSESPEYVAPKRQNHVRFKQPVSVIEPNEEQRFEMKYPESPIHKQPVPIYQPKQQPQHIGTRPSMREIQQTVNQQIANSYSTGKDIKIFRD